MNFTLAELTEATGGVLSPPDTAATGIGVLSIDSRTIGPGDLFVPLVAERDGHDFVRAAVMAGASAFLTAVADDRLDLGPDHHDTPRIRVADTVEALTAIGAMARSRMTGPVIGITGSVGKTSVKDLTKAACGGGGVGPLVWASAKSFNNEIGVPLTLANAPDDVAISIIEMGARGIGHIAKLCETARPTIGVITTIAMVHSELFGSIEAVAQGKGELIEALPADGVAVLYADNPHVMSVVERSSAPVLTFGVAPDADVRVSDVKLDRSLHPTFQLTHGGESRTVTVPVAGAHMAVNAAAAVATAMAAGIAFEIAADQVGAVELSPWRMEVSTTPGGALVVNDAYNANPTSMRAALAALNETGAAHLVAVVGEMAELGEEGPAEHAAITGEAVAAGIRVVAVGSPAYGPAAEHVADIDGALAALGDLGGDSAVLVKGSRVAGLERLAARLVDPTP
ncbi:MAG: UDP-N-acetylmuramoyl-tripeptide--D-alanyl-D-alanine ligase [Acidimicrobiia bacterium]|nr:UDP-N-acetylmuramoyl-tripeptide--D-alanyl-D-alanine ligase [Acidimicrobiia bacterium]